METDHGAKASAMIYSIIETAKANELNTYQYLELLLTELPKHSEDKNLSFLDELLPWSPRVQKECQVNTKNLNFSRFIKIYFILAEMRGFLLVWYS